MSDTEATKPKLEDSTNPEPPKEHEEETVPQITPNAAVSTATPVLAEEDTADGDVVKNNNTAALSKKKELIRPLFLRTSTTEKTSKQAPNKSMIVETETIDASNVPSVTLPIGSTSNLISNVISSDMMSTNSSISNNLASLRTRKSTLFVDQNNSASNLPANTTPTVEDDNVSVNGSLRNFNRRLNQAESHLNIPKSGATKADLFAAKIANAVGDASDSDSEETFVYESAPDALNSTNTLPNKTISALSSTNPLALRKLSQRNISMPVTSNSHLYSSSTASHMVLTNDDSKDTNNQTFDTENESDVSNSGSHNNTIVLPSNSAQEKLYIMKSSLELNQNGHNNNLNSNSNSNSNTASSPNSNSNSNPNSKSSKSKLFTKYHGDSRKIGSVAQCSQNLPKSSIPSQLRTTTSKLFDVKGSSLRRYSGVPDDINIEDYIDQYDEEQEIGAENYSDTYDYDDYEEDDELTPLNVSNANNNLRSKMNNHYFNRRSLPNFRSTDSGEDFAYNKDEHFTNTNSTKAKNKKYKARPQHQQRLQQAYSPHNFHNTKKNTKLQTFKNFVYFFVLVFILLTFGFVAGFLLATTKDLQNVQIHSVDNIVTSYDELIFDLAVKAFNPGFVSVEISEIELDIFAKSSYLDKARVLPIYQDGSLKDIQTILLGSIAKFETPLEFASGFFNRNYSVSKGEIKLLHPGQNSTDAGEHDGSDKQGENHKIENDSDKWKTIMKHPFDLIIRGTFKYDLPFYHTERSVAVTKTITIDPAHEILDNL